MKIIALLSDRNHRRSVRHVCHTLGWEADFFTPEELDDIECDIPYSRLVLAANYEDDDATFILRQLRSKFAHLENNAIAIIDNGAVEFSGAQGHLISEYHLESQLTQWLKANTPQQTQKCLLYISDDRLMHAIVKDLYKSEETQLLQAYDGLSGYQIYKEYHPNLILTDLDIPLLDGFELLQRIKGEDQDVNTTILLFSSTADEETIMKAYALKAKGYLVKPLAPKVLKLKVDKYLHAH